MSKVKSKIEALTDANFLPGLFDSWEILIKENEFSLEKSYMNIGFSTEGEANREKLRIIRDRNYFSVEVRKIKIRKLKNPISIS